MFCCYFSLSKECGSRCFLLGEWANIVSTIFNMLPLLKNNLFFDSIFCFSWIVKFLIFQILLNQLVKWLQEGETSAVFNREIYGMLVKMECTFLVIAIHKIPYFSLLKYCMTFIKYLRIVEEGFYFRGKNLLTALENETLDKSLIMVNGLIFILLSSI